jgi:hypothetical protein
MSECVSHLSRVTHRSPPSTRGAVQVPPWSRARSLLSRAVLRSRALLSRAVLRSRARCHCCRCWHWPNSFFCVSIRTIRVSPSPRSQFDTCHLQTCACHSYPLACASFCLFCRASSLSSRPWRACGPVTCHSRGSHSAAIFRLTAFSRASCASKALNCASSVAAVRNCCASSCGTCEGW